MSSYGAKIFNNAVSAINAQQAIIAATANNIANVNTEGYVRRVVNLQTRFGATDSNGISLGSGVEIGGISRVNDQFLEGLTRDALSASKSFEAQRDFMARVEPLFSLADGVSSIGNSLTQFFNALENLSLNPASVELRADVLERAQDLVSSINTTFNSIASLQTEAENRIESEVESINTLTAQIAALNGQIGGIELSGGVAADQRDQRDVLLERLAEKISYNMVENADGSVNISLANGFSIVNGINSRSLEVTGSPSFAGGNIPPKLDGSNMKYIVYDYDPASGSAAHLDLTSVLRNGGGVVGGLLTMRGHADITDTTAFQADGSLVELAGRVEAISRDLLTRFNSRYLGPEATADPTVGFFDPSAIDLNGNNPNPFGFFTINGIANPDLDADGVPEVADLNAIITAGTVRNFSSMLSLAISNPEEIAAARDEVNGTALAEGSAANLVGSDALAGIIDLKTATATMNSDSFGSFSRAGVSYGQFYNETVGRVGSLALRADTNYSVTTDNYIAARTKREQVSGVSLDEEFTNLIRFQKAFEANARVLRIGEELMDTIVQIL